MTQKLIPLKKFRVYLDNSSLYFLVHIWRTKKELVGYRKQQKLKRNYDVTAFTYSYDLLKINRKTKQARKLPIVGELHFHKSRLGTEVIIHETSHAINSTLRRLKFNFEKLNKEPDNDSEELMAYLLGKFSSNLVYKLYKLKML